MPNFRTLTAVLTLAGLAFAAAPLPGTVPQALASPVAARALPDFAGLVEAHGKAVVAIAVQREARAAGVAAPGIDENHPLYEFFRRFGVPNAPQSQTPAQGVGSGFIVSADGFILTNAHVVAGASEVSVRLTDKREFKARVVGSDQRTDVALLKVEATGLPTVRIGNPDKVRVGEWVAAIGSPFGLENTVTAGIVSAKSRAINEGYVPFLQTDVAVNPGNSGGPLFNLDGEVIGINSMIYSRTGGYMGLSFAIPIDTAMKVKDQLAQFGKVQRGRIGVAIQGVTRELATSFGLGEPRGALVANVEPGSPAEKAGLAAGDIILAANGRDIAESVELPRLIGDTRPGQRVTLRVLRAGSQRDLAVTVGEMPAERPTRRG